MDYQVILESELSRRQRKNRAYSLRSFAKDLGLDSSTLSSVLRGKRKLPRKKASEVADRIGLSPLKKQEFLDSIRYSGKALKGIEPIKNSHLLDAEAHYKIIAEWEHYAVLSLVLTKDFKSQMDFIAKRLGLSVASANDVVRRLVDSGLLIQDKLGLLKPSYRRLATTDGIPSQALRKSHKEAMEMGIAKIDAVPLKFHSYSSETIAFDKSRVSEARKIIQEFREKFNSLMTDSQSDEVYQLCIQFYPLTEIQNLEDENENK
jgi:uncharacterized protein (TIGR02147 family)